MKVVLKEYYIEDSVIRDGMRDAGAKLSKRNYMAVLSNLQDFIEMDCDEVRRLARDVSRYMLGKGRIDGEDD